MSVPKSTRVWILNERPTDAITDKTFRVEEKPLPSKSDLEKGQFIVKTLALSNDPAQRTWMDDHFDPKRMYAPPIFAGDAIRSSIMGEVVASNSDKFKEGSRVIAGTGQWAEYIVLKEDLPMLAPAIDLPNQSEYIGLSAVGLTGLTAYVGAFAEMKLKPEHVLVVSGAAGAVGSILVQLAKNVIGCKKVVGIAGGKEKCDWVKSLGADECIDYKDKNYAKLLADALPDYADVYFDNVGGDILNTMFTLVKRYGFISACGAISGYNDKGFTLTNWGEVIFNRITIKGFIVIDHPQLLGKGREELAGWIKEGKITNTEGETVVEANFNEIPATYQKLFQGANRGKLITKLV